MAGPMESPRTTLALGPLEISIRRRDDNVRRGVLASLVAHALFVAALMFVTPPHKSVVDVDAIRAANPPIPISFANPLPPPPAPKTDEIATRRPPPAAELKPLRMQSVPETIAARSDATRERDAARGGRLDKNPPGGQAGGPQSQPTPGMPPPRSETVASNTDEPKDIFGRLRDFKQAVEAPRPSNPGGPMGGGHGRGGVTMPNLPSIGFGNGTIEFEGHDYDWENYGRQILGIIWRAWHNRLLYTSGVFERWAVEHKSWILDDRTFIRFTILRTGQVVGIAIETPSGCYPLDDSATEALKEAVLPPLPQDFQRESENVRYAFIAVDIEIRAMRPSLQQLKSQGFF